MAATYGSKTCIKELEEKLEIDNKLKSLLEASIQKADKIASDKLDKPLYQAFEKENAWPRNCAEYIAYLEWFARWIPHQSDDPAWLAPGTDEHQEVLDHLCHFYWLVDQEVEGGKIVQDIPWFADWLVKYAKLWGSFLDSTESFNDQVLESFLKLSPEFEVGNSMIKSKDNGERPNMPSGWLTFNQFFARELNPGLRPISSPFDNKVITCPADCTYRAHYKINQDSCIPEISIKGTHKYANVKDLLEGSAYKEAFAGGTFIHYFLGPYSYHRFHTPVAGLLKECYPVHGKVYLDVVLKDGQFDAPDSSQGGYEFSQARGIVTMDTTNSPYGDVGIVCVIPIGMAHVSSVNMTAQPGNNMMKGDEFGYFLFGGSDIIVLLQKDIDPIINFDTTYHHYGTWIANSMK